MNKEFLSESLKKRKHESPSPNWKDYIKVSLKEVKWKYMDLIHMAHDTDHWQSPVYVVPYLWVPRIFQSSWVTVRFSVRILLFVKNCVLRGHVWDWNFQGQTEKSSLFHLTVDCSASVSKNVHTNIFLLCSGMKTTHCIRNMLVWLNSSIKLPSSCHGEIGQGSRIKFL
jgi:hypothetical protein